MLTTLEEKIKNNEKSKAWYKKNSQIRKDSCKKWKEKNPNYHKEWAKKNPLRSIDNLYKKISFTKEDFIKLNKKQKEVCAICFNKNKSSRLYIDHCHEKNIVRGLLCMKCNSLLGHAKDNIKTLKSAIKYLKKYE